MTVAKKIRRLRHPNIYLTVADHIFVSAKLPLSGPDIPGPKDTIPEEALEEELLDD